MALARLLSRGTVLGFIAVTLLALACTTGTRTPEPAATDVSESSESTPESATPSPVPPAATARAAAPTSRTPARDPVVFSFGSTVPDADRAVVQGGVEVAVRYLEAAAGLRPVPATVYAYSDLGAMQAAILRSSEASILPVDMIGRRLGATTAESFPRNIFINTGSQVWRDMVTVQRFRTAGHEYFHVVQMEVLGPAITYKIFTTSVTAERAEGPSWLFEGGADWISWKALEAAGLGSLAAHLAATPPSRDVELSELESYLEYFLAEEARISLSVAAVDRLLVGRGASDLIGFYRLVGAGQPWPSAFVSSFGRTVEQFYAEFEALLGR